MAEGMERFRARLQKDGPNAFVRVPARVSRAFRNHARAGRVRVEGLINGTPIRGTFVPVASGGHRLFVNLAFRRAASVDFGGTARFELRPASWEIETPDDVARGLRRREGALAAFDALPPSHRRELLRYIDDAKTKESRKRRIEKAAEHALGRPSRPGKGRKDRPLWSCPKCGNEFVNKNTYHSCRRGRIEDVFAGKPESVRALFDRLRDGIEAMGPVKLVPYRDRVAFMTRVRFAGASPRMKWLDVGFWLTRRIESPRLRRVETLLPNAHVHWLRVADASELDAELLGWLREAYAVGRQEHLV
jgi:hypothetical protein